MWLPVEVSQGQFTEELVAGKANGKIQTTQQITGVCPTPWKQGTVAPYGCFVLATTCGSYWL